MRTNVRIAAVGDIHFTEGLVGALRAQYARVNDDADVLLLAGDLTNMGRPSEVEALLDELSDVTVPMAAVLGNHDHQSDAAQVIGALIQDRGIHLVDGARVVLGVGAASLGIAGVKGFCGGFAPHLVNAFGERELKAFVEESVHEGKKLSTLLADLDADVRVVLLHYAPITETLGDEPRELHAFLGSSLLLQPLEDARVHAVFHAHAHLGRHEGRTPGGIPVYNMAMPVLRRPYCVITL